MERTIERIPTWALSALVNDDYSELTDKDIDTIAEWYHKNRLVVICPTNYDEYFTSCPAFGKATMVMDCICENY